MPKIPVFNEDPQMFVRSPVPVRDSSAYREPGQALSELGQGASNFAVSLQDLENKREQTAVSTGTFSAATYGTQLGQSINDDVRRTGKSDGSDWVQNFNDAFSGAKNEYLQTIDDPSVRDAASTRLEATRNQFTGKLYNDSRKAFIDDAQNQVEQSSVATGTSIYKDPSVLPQAMTDLDHALEGNHAFGPAAQMKIRDQTRKDYAARAVDGLIDAGQFDAAKTLTTQVLPEYVPAAVHQALYDKVLQEQHRSSEWGYQGQQQFDARQRVAEQKAQKQNEDTLLSQAYTASPDQLGAVMDQGLKLLRAGMIRPAGFAALVSIRNSPRKQGVASPDAAMDDHDSVNDLLGSLRTEDPEAVSDTAIQALNSGKLTAQGFQSVTQAAHQRTMGQLSDPTVQAAMKQADETLDQHFGPNPTDRQAVLLKNRAMIERDALVQKGVSPYDASMQVAVKYLPPLGALPKIQDESGDQSSPAGLRAAVSDIEQKRLAGRITDAQARDRVALATRRNQALERLEYQKSAGKK